MTITCMEKMLAVLLNILAGKLNRLSQTNLSTLFFKGGGSGGGGRRGDMRGQKLSWGEMT